MTRTPLRDTSGTPEQGTRARLVWDRPAKDGRERLTRDAVIAAAIVLADAEGLDAVSIRRVAATLSTRPMGLYSFFDRKDELIDLMVDEVLSAAVLPEVPADWRAGLSALAHATRDVCTAHPWLVAAAGTRPQIGPNALRHLDQSLQAVAGLEVSPARKRAILRAVDTYALGQVQASLARQETLRREGLSTREWQAAVSTYVARLTASGNYPHLAAFDTDALLRDDSEEPAFETGLNWLLDGIASEVG